MAAGDLRFLLGLGLSVEQLANRTGRTKTAIVNELKNDEQETADDDKRWSGKSDKPQA